MLVNSVNSVNLWKSSTTPFKLSGNVWAGSFRLRERCDLRIAVIWTQLILSVHVSSLKNFARFDSDNGELISASYVCIPNVTDYRHD